MQDWLKTMITLLAGGALTILTAWLADNRLNKRERESRREEQQERLQVRRSEFQRDTLLDLQNTSQGLLRNAGALHFQSVLAVHEAGERGRKPLSENLSDEHLQLQTRVMLLASRVRDDEIRELVDALKAGTSSVIFAKSEVESRALFMQIMETQSQLLVRTGELIRSLD
jgi:hypothetical protein